MDTTAFKLFILFMYSGKLGRDESESQLSVTDLINVLRIGNYFYHSYLQEYLIAKVIIPSMTPAKAVSYLKECTTENKNHRRSSSKEAWDFLKEYSFYYLQKHLSSLLRTNPTCMYELDPSIIHRVITKSFIYIVDGTKDLETILQFTANTFADKSITKLLLSSQNQIDSCSAFDYQIIH